MKRYLGVDQFGVMYNIGRHPPRKYLMDFLRAKHAEKMYNYSGHVGWVIARRWIHVYEVKELHEDDAKVNKKIAQGPVETSLPLG
jgi:hypothetical protein